MDICSSLIFFLKPLQINIEVIHEISLYGNMVFESNVLSR
jgi:hypothetical protein